MPLPSECDIRKLRFGGPLSSLARMPRIWCTRCAPSFMATPLSDQLE